MVAEEASGAPRSVGRFCVQWTALCFLSQSSPTCLRVRTFSRIPHTLLTVLCSARWSWRPPLPGGRALHAWWFTGSSVGLRFSPDPGLSSSSRDFGLALAQHISGVLQRKSATATHSLGPECTHPGRPRPWPGWLCFVWLFFVFVAGRCVVWRFLGFFFAISFPCCLPSSLDVIFVSGRTLCAHGFAPRTQVSWIDGDRVRPSSCLNFFGCGLPFRPSSLSTFSSFEPRSLARRISTSGV